MSWVVEAVGRAEAVRQQVKTLIARSKCIEPEETIKNLVGQAIDDSLAGYPAHTPVRVKASGSQQGAALPAVNSLSVEITPIYGFLEDTPPATQG